MTEDGEKDGKLISVNDKKSFKLPPFDDPKYRAAVDDDLTEEQVVKILKSLDVILRICVDIGFGVDAVQLAVPALAEFNKQSESLADFSGPEESGAVQIDSPTNDFNNAVQLETPQKE